MQKATIVIPAYKPIEKQLVPLTEALLREFSVLLVDDGGGEEYAPVFEKLKKLGARVLVHEVNKGKGAALKTAIKYLKATGEEHLVVTADADGQHTLKDIRAVAAKLAKNKDKLVLGVRSFKNMPARSKIGNSVTRFFFRAVTGLQISDTQTGLRGFSSRLFDKLVTANGDRYEYEMNVLLSLKDWRIGFTEVPIETVYIDGNSSSHFHALRDSFTVIGQVLKHTAASFFCTALDYVLFFIFEKYLTPEWAYVCARGMSAVLNYQLSCRVVFNSKPSVITAISYGLLVIASFSIGAIGVWFLCEIGVPSLVAKIPVDSVLFFANYFVQKNVVFNNSGSHEDVEE